MVVREVAREDPSEVSLVDHDDVIKTLAAYRADYALRIRVLPRRSRCDEHFLDAHVSHAPLKHVAVDSIAITNEKTRHCIIGDIVRPPDW